MRICYIGDASSVHTQRWVNYFAENGHSVQLISTKEGEGYLEGVQLHHLARLTPRIWALSKYPSGLMWVLQTWRLINKIKPDVVHSHYITVYGYLAAVSDFRPLVLTAWGSDILIDAKRNIIYTTLTKFALKRADSITCDADHMVESLVQLGAKAEKIELIYFGVDTRKFHPNRRDEKLRQELGILDSPAVISARSLRPLYDVESLVKAIPLVLKEIPNIKFIIAGDGDQKEYLEKLASSLGASNNVRFVGWISQSELPKYFASADIYVSTSLSDAGLAASTAEAMACGLPVIVTDFGDNRKWIQDGANGYVVPVSNPEVLASKIIYLLRNADDRIKFGKANRKVIEEKNSREKELQKVEKIYEKMIARYKK